MDAQLKQIQIKPAQYDKEGEITKEEYATITFNVPLDSDLQRKAVLGLFSVLRDEWIKVDIETKQLALDQVAEGKDFDIEVARDMRNADLLT